jgi:rfaE bifunctional protein nucleotidyltransferase chain/domain
MDLLKFIEEARKDTFRIVFTNGCFDIIHSGHIELFKKITEMGLLIVGLNSDESIKSLKDKKFRPINNEDDRKEVLDAIKYVDYVQLFDEPTPLNLIKKIKPDILVKGRDWKKGEIVGEDFVESYGGKVMSIDLKLGKSTSHIIRQCWLSTERFHLEMSRGGPS